MSTGTIYAGEEFHESLWEMGQERRRLQKVDNIPHQYDTPILQFEFVTLLLYLEQIDLNQTFSFLLLFAT